MLEGNTSNSKNEENEVNSEALWLNSLSSLRNDVDPEIFSAYLSRLRLVSFDAKSTEFKISAPSSLVCKHVEENFGPRLCGLLANTIGSDTVNLKFLVETRKTSDKLSNQESLDSNSSARPYVVVKKIAPQQKSESAAKATTNEPVSSIAAFGHGPNPRYTFENFVVGNSNEFCHAAAMQVAEKPGASYNPLFIYGGVGLGKTHLMHAIGNSVLKAKPNARVLYLSSEAFTNALIQSLRQGKMDEFKNRMRNIEVLLIDDIQFMRGKETTQEEFFHTFNALYSAKHQIVITSDKNPTEIPGIEERLKTRFAWGLTADLQAPDFETRVAILKDKAVREGFNLPEAAAHFISESFASNVRELEGALTRLNAVASLQKVPITLELAHSALKSLLQPKLTNISVDEIKKVVSAHYNIKVSEMVSKRRNKHLAFPRHVAMYLCRKHTTYSYPEIGQVFGGRDHSSVIHAANVITQRVQSNNELRTSVEEIEKKLFWE